MVGTTGLEPVTLCL